MRDLAKRGGEAGGGKGGRGVKSQTWLPSQNKKREIWTYKFII